MSARKRTQNFKYIRIREGNFYYSTDKEFKDPYQEIYGQIVNFQFKTDEWEGKEIEKLLVFLHDKDEYEVISFGIDSSYFSSFVAFAKNADLSQPLSLHLSVREEKDVKGKDVTRRAILISQNGTFMKKYYTKDHPNGLPMFKKVKISGRDHWDKTEFLEFLKDVVVNELLPQLPAYSNTSVVKNEVEDTIEADELPF